ncbi:MAG: DUF4982 domain-containing protein [Firmicutes bacterium]|nr:DUF4982 domain-containing protein [Bacillota bacterium]
MRVTQDIRKGWKFAACDYPEGAVIDRNPWMPQTPSSIWEGLDHVPAATTDWIDVDLPYIWDKEDPTQALPRLYEKTITLDKPGEDRQYFASFGGVFGLCKVFLNGVLLGEHRGGHTRFRVDLTPAARDGENTLTVFADNTIYNDICPMSGDFAKYGGIYRETELICLPKDHFDICWYGTEGLVIDTFADGTVKAEAKTVGGDSIRCKVYDAAGAVVAECETESRELELHVADPTLWDGLANPYLYTIRAELVTGGEVQDVCTMQIGFRKAEMTADHGFFLNGKHVRINGVARHQDREGCGPAETNEQLDEDFAIIREIGANAVRLSHYPHNQYTYDICDRMGLLVWAEIPMLSMPDGNEGIMRNAEYQMHELLTQYRHHPSIVFWGVQNEVAIMGETIGMRDRIEKLHNIVKELKPDAITASSNEYTVRHHSPLNRITDMQAYNLYYGWYYGELGQLEHFFDRFHTVNPQVPIGISEYGVDCRTTLHQANPKREDYSEEYQTTFHEATYPSITAHEWIWGSFIWNMFDFSSPHRSFEPLLGQNRKGLVTFDRKTRKDAFYYYKANWSDEPFVHLCESRFAVRTEEQIRVKAYSNQDSVTLFVNGVPFGTQKGQYVFNFENVPLQKGINVITAQAGSLTDSMKIERKDEPEKSYIYVNPNPGIQVRDWVTGASKSEELFPEGKLSILDEMRNLYTVPEAWAILQQEVPELTTERYQKSGTALVRCFDRSPVKHTEEFIKELNRKLTQIDRPEFED